MRRWQKKIKKRKGPILKVDHFGGRQEEKLRGKDAKKKHLAEAKNDDSGERY